MINSVKKLCKYTNMVIVVLTILALLPVFLVYRKYLQYKITKDRNKRLKEGINIL